MLTRSLFSVTLYMPLLAHIHVICRAIGADFGRALRVVPKSNLPVLAWPARLCLGGWGVT